MALFLRAHERRKDGKVQTYWSLVENRRCADGRVVQRHVLYLGALTGAQELSWEKTAKQFDAVPELGYWQVLDRVLRPGTSLLAMVRLASTCAAAAMLGCRLAFTEDDLYTNGAWLEGRHEVIERRLSQSRATQLKGQLLCFPRKAADSWFRGGEAGPAPHAPRRSPVRLWQNRAPPTP